MCASILPTYANEKNSIYFCTLFDQKSWFVEVVFFHELKKKINFSSHNFSVECNFPKFYGKVEVISCLFSISFEKIMLPIYVLRFWLNNFELWIHHKTTFLISRQKFSVENNSLCKRRNQLFSSLIFSTLFKLAHSIEQNISGFDNKRNLNTYIDILETSLYLIYWVMREETGSINYAQMSSNY